MEKSNKGLGTVRVWAIICLFLSISVVYFWYNYRVNSSIQLVTVPYANETIQPGVEITDDMVSRISVPKAFLVSDYFESTDEIVGKCTTNKSVIIEGSIFYGDLLNDCQDMD